MSVESALQTLQIEFQFEIIIENIIFPHVYLLQLYS